MRIKTIIPAKKNVPSGVTNSEIAPPKLEPTNRWTVERSAVYARELRSSMAEVVENTRELFLKEIFPIALSLTNGFADANEVLVASLGESSSAAPIMSVVEGFMLQAIRTRILLFVSKEFKLSPVEAQVYLLSALSKDGVNQGSIDDRVETLLQQMQSLSNLPRTKQGAEVQLQQLQEKQRAQRGTRVQSVGADATRRKRSRGEEAEEVAERSARGLRNISKRSSRPGI